MKTRLLAGAALAALIGVAQPAFAGSSPELPSASQASPTSAAVGAFYAHRGDRPFWTANPAAANKLLDALDRAPLDGLASGPTLAARGRALLASPAARAEAERFLSTAFLAYADALQSPPPGMTYADQWVTPKRTAPAQMLAAAAAAPSLAGYVDKLSSVNPVYRELREAAYRAGTADPRTIANLARARMAPFQSRYVMVDAGGARLYMIEDGRIADTMKVIVGKPDATHQTPMLASTIYYATLNPYWHVSPELVRSLIAKNVLEQGVTYLKTRGYQVQPAPGQGDELLDPSTIDWRAVADGRTEVRVRQLPGPANSMGHVKIGFPNATDIYLHDTPVKEAFAQDDRNLSHGCVRLEDAPRLARWLLGREPQKSGDAPEQNMLLPTPVPIYITYLTAQTQDGRLSFVNDVYERDSSAAMQVASLR